MVAGETHLRSEHKLDQLRLILRLLEDGNYHSGQKIAEHLQVSRAYVWKLLKELQEYGLNFESVSGKGYCWKGASQLLDERKLKNSLPNLSIDYGLIKDSTNQQLKNTFSNNKLCLAEYQTAGRGRRGRQWQSPIAANIYASLSWKTDLPIQQLGGLSLVVGMALIKSLEKMGFEDLQLKWPNDIRYKSKKLAGILIELSGDASGGLEVIIGFGLNVNMDLADKALEQSIEQPWTSLLDIKNEPCNRQQVLVSAIKEVQEYQQRFSSDGFESFLNEWQLVDETLNKPVRLIQTNETLKGVARGIDPSGALLLEVQTETENKIIPCYAGEVSLRLA